jgi:phenylpropionate dioxygenase-like ring-hydroxylating dioxygenase large terminal subunit
MVNQQPLVAFRSQDGRVQLLPDACPHRFAPLSKGKIIDGEIQCPYHGWQFNGQGVCTRVPGLATAPGCKPILTACTTLEAEGLVWMSSAADVTAACLPSTQKEALDIFYLQSTVQCELIDAIENFLDGFHTHFVHAGWIRKDTRRQTINATLSPLPDGLQVEYTGESQQNGFISRWLEAERGISIARFRLPNMAELEYRDARDRLSLLASVWATPMNDHCHNIFVRIATPRRLLPAWLKMLVLRPLFLTILQQDKKILESAYQRKCELASGGLEPEPLDTSNDLLAPLLREIIRTQKAISFAPKTCQVIV